MGVTSTDPPALMRPLLTSALALLILAAPAVAQGTLAPAALPTVDTDPPAVSARVVDMLESASADDRSAALHEVASLAFSTPEGADLRPALMALLQIAQSDADPRHRILAFRCLQASGNETAMETVRAGAWKETDATARRVLFSILHDHYGADELRRDPGIAEMVRSIRADLGS